MATPRYRAEKNEDGTFSIFGVPIFGEMEKGARQNTKALRRSWMEGAIAKCKTREKEGYRYRLHVFHHGDETKPGVAGTFTLTKVKRLSIGGKPMDVLHADLHDVPEWVFTQIQAGELLYRSVEIHDINGDPEIDSVALLSTETPYFRLPVTDGETVTLDQAQVAQPAGVVAFYLAGAGGTAVFKESAPMKKMTLSVDKDGVLVGRTEAGTEFRASETDAPRQREFTITTPEGVFAATFAKGKDDDEDDSEEMAALKSQIAELEAKLKKCEDDDADPVDDPEDKKNMKKKKMSSDSTAAVKLQARLDVLEERDADRTRKERAETRSTKAVAGLKTAGWHVPERCRESIAKLADNDDETLLDSYVEEFKATRPKDPVRVRGTAGGRPEPEVHAEVLKFNADGPDAFEKALKCSAEYDELKSHGLAGGMSREQYLAAHMTPVVERR